MGWPLQGWAVDRRKSLISFHKYLGLSSGFFPSSYHICICRMVTSVLQTFNRLTPNDAYSGLTTPLTSKRCSLFIYSTNTVVNILNVVYTLRFFLFKMQFVS